MQTASASRCRYIFVLLYPSVLPVGLRFEPMPYVQLLWLERRRIDVRVRLALSVKLGQSQTYILVEAPTALSFARLSIFRLLDQTLPNAAFAGGDILFVGAYHPLELLQRLLGRLCCSVQFAPRLLARSVLVVPPRFCCFLYNPPSDSSAPELIDCAVWNIFYVFTRTYYSPGQHLCNLPAVMTSILLKTFA